MGMILIHARYKKGHIYGLVVQFQFLCMQQRNHVWREYCTLTTWNYKAITVVYQWGGGHVNDGATSIDRTLTLRLKSKI